MAKLICKLHCPFESCDRYIIDWDEESKRKYKLVLVDGAVITGSAAEMLTIAIAIESKNSVQNNDCAISYNADRDIFKIYHPAHLRSAIISCWHANSLAKEIRKTIGKLKSKSFIIALTS